ncbi:response regulator [Microvirga massiliensis]|uniref:response regulator n=1 Tax=Microvirga massiliensis TaxID=1033741 RepID=UPI00062B8D6D|nr:response regulator [Microvirga massiliensis]
MKPICSRSAFLVAEDDEMLCEMISLFLTKLKYEVIITARGEEALSILEYGEDIAGLYTDIHLGGRVDGWELGAAFHNRWPARPIVYASSRAQSLERVAPTGLFLQKPFALARLTAALMALQADLHLESA